MHDNKFQEKHFPPQNKNNFHMKSKDPKIVELYKKSVVHTEEINFLGITFFYLWECAKLKLGNKFH